MRTALAVVALLGLGIPRADLHAAPAPSTSATPLLDHASTLHFDTMPDDDGLRSRLEAARHTLEQTPPPKENCASTLGAARFADGFAELASVYDSLGDRARAADYWRRALACTPRAANRYGQLAGSLLAADRHAEARHAAERGLAIDPKDYVSRATLAQLEFTQRRYAEAEKQVRALLEGAGDTMLSTYWQLMLWLAQRHAGNEHPQLPLREASTDPADESSSIWPMPVLEALLGKRTEASVLEAILDEEYESRRREMLCEALFYLGELRLATGREDLARRYFAATINLKVHAYSEHVLALVELRRLTRRGEPGSNH